MNGFFRDPDIADGEKSVYRIRFAEDASQSAEVVSTVQQYGDGYVNTVDVGSEGSMRMAVEQRFVRHGGNLAAEWYKAASYDDENLVSREEGYFSGTRHIQFGGKVGPFPRGVMPLVGGLVLLRGMDFRKNAKVEHAVWLAYSVSWPLHVKVEKRMTVDVPAGTFDAWQVRIRPGFGHINGLLDKVVAGFLPPFVAHLDAGATHRLLRFSFPTGPMPWDPRGVLELTS